MLAYSTYSLYLVKFSDANGNTMEANMRTKFIEVADRRTAKRRAPWAAKIVKVHGGYRAFESLSDYATWRKQK